jgi:hypothetical protein
LETLHSETEALRAALTASAEREAALLALLHAERDTDREGRLLALLEADREELQRLRTPPPRPVPERPPDPLPTTAFLSEKHPHREPSELHAKIVEALAASSPQGLTARELESAVGSPTPLKHVLRHLARSGRLVRRGDGRFDVADAVLVGAALNGTGP